MRRAPRSKLQFKGIRYKTRIELIHAVNNVCEKLSKSLPLEEQAEGWTDANRIYVLQYFQEVGRALQSSAGISFYSLLRALDGMGINNGDLLDEVCEINNAVNALEL